MFSAKAIFVKLLYGYGLSAAQALFLRAIFSLPVYIFLAVKFSTNEKIKPKDYLWILLFGFIGYYLASLFDFLGLEFLSASMERIILFIYPTLVLLLSALFLKNKIQRLQIIAVIITYLGVVLAFSGELSQKQDSNTYMGGVYILLSALTYAGYLVGSQWLIPKFGVGTFTSYAMIVSCICILGHYYLVDGTPFWVFPRAVYYYGIAIAVFSTIIPSYLVSSAIQKLGASDFAILAGLGPVSTVVLAHIFLNETLNWQQTLGSVVVIIGVTIIGLKK